MKFSIPQCCPIPGCTHPPIETPGAYDNHVRACRRKYIERSTAAETAAIIEPNSMKAALYARVSKRDGTQTIENQVRAMREYAARQGWKIAGEYLDKASGAHSERKRDALAELMQHADRRRFDVVIVFALDRLT